MADPPTRETALYPPFAELLPAESLVDGGYEVRFARTAEELDAILRLRFEVFNLELGEGLESSFATGRDRDEFDALCHHLMVLERATGEVVGTYRLQTSAMAASGLGFYSATEFDLGGFPPEVIGDAVELGRACVAVDHRNTHVLFLLWRGLALYVATQNRRYLFGCCSLTSQDPEEGRAVMRYLSLHGHLHPVLRVRPLPAFECYPGEAEVDPRQPAEPTPDAPGRPRPGRDPEGVRIPKLFRIYLRHGAKVCGPPAIDRRFKTIDYLVIFDVASMSERQFKTFFG